MVAFYTLRLEFDCFLVMGYTDSMHGWSNLKVVAVLCAVVFVTGVLHTPYADGTVLCIGDDGHFDIESASDGNCISVISPETPYSSGENQYTRSAYNDSESDHCGECRDVPICDHEEVVVVTTRYATQDNWSPPSASFVDFTIDRITYPQGYSVLNLSQPTSFSLISLRSVSLQR